MFCEKVGAWLRSRLDTRTTSLRAIYDISENYESDDDRLAALDELQTELDAIECELSAWTAATEGRLVI